MRIGPRQLLCADPEVLRMMSAARSEYTKGAFYGSGRVVPGVDNVVSMRNEAKHKAMRAQMAPAVCLVSWHASLLPFTNPMPFTIVHCHE